MRCIVVVPTYNESDNVAKMIEAVLTLPDNFHILVVDDNSPDGTADLAAPYCAKYDRVHLIRRTGPRGFGPSYIDGFQQAIEKGFEAIFSMDCDFSHNPADLPRLAEALKDSDIAVACRYYQGRVSVVNWPIHRLLISLFAGRYVRGITGLRLSDPTSGFRGFRAKAMASISLDTVKSNGYSFLVETLYRAKRCGFTMQEVPIVFTERRDGQSKMSKKIMFEAALMPWRLRFGGFRGPGK
jgi:dolichol-phosphate mannosyltransferase